MFIVEMRLLMDTSKTAQLRSPRTPSLLTPLAFTNLAVALLLDHMVDGALLCERRDSRSDSEHDPDAVRLF